MNIDKVFAAAANDIKDSAIFPGLSDTEELKACVLDLLPLEHQDIKSLTVQGTLSKFKSSFNCALPEDNIEKFIEAYNKKTNETLKLAVSKKLSVKSGYEVNKTFRCHHNTRYAGTENSTLVLSQKPAKRFKNTCCPFKMVIKKVKSGVAHPFSVTLEWNHNHPVNSLQAWNFKDVPPHVIDEINSLYERGLTPALAYREYMSCLRNLCKDDLEFHLKKGKQLLKHVNKKVQQICNLRSKAKTNLGKSTGC